MESPVTKIDPVRWITEYLYAALAIDMRFVEFDTAKGRVSNDPSRHRGWSLDPFKNREARWFSDGTPTSLVRDPGVESRDEPPNTTYAGELELVPQSLANTADASIHPPDVDQDATGERISEVFEATGGD